MSDNPTRSDRLPLLTPDELNPAQRALYDRIQAEQVPWATKSGFTAATPDGRLLGPFNSRLYAPEFGQAYLDYFTAEKKNTTLPQRVHEIVILTVGSAWNSAYELYAHSAVGKAAGLPDAVIQALVSGQLPEGLTEPESSAYEFTKQLAGSSHRVEAATYARTQTAFGNRGLVDIVNLVGLYLATCAALNAFEVPVP